MRVSGIFGFFILALALLAQDPYGHVTGRVVDPTGAVDTGAGIRMTNIATNVISRSSTDAQGNYEIRSLVPGRYRLAIE